MRRLITFLLFTIAIPLFAQQTTGLRKTTNLDMLEIPKGNFENTSSVNKFGYAVSGLQTTMTDIWDLADATPTKQIWVAPDSALVHKIVSTSDDDSVGGVGANTIRIYGLTSWDADEVSEVISLEGTDSVETVNEYVIIHRMKVLTSGATNINVGNIKAVASINISVTAQISAGFGQTEMAIYGVPSTKTAYLTHWYGGIMKTAASAATAQYYLRVNENPDEQLKNFIVKSIRGVQSTGDNTADWFYEPYMKFTGPCIIKVSGIGSAADIDASGGFDLILVDN